MINVEKKKFGLGSVNILVDLILVLFTAYGSFQNGWFTLANLVSWLGLIGVIGLAKKWQGNFFFNGLQNLSAAIVAFSSKLYGDMFMSIFYLGSQIFGFTNWKKHRDKDGELEVDKKGNWLTIISSIVIGFIILGFTSWKMGGAFIILDAFNNSTAIVAQTMQMKRMRNSWLLWALTNIVGIIIWLGVGVPQMAIMYTVFTVNSIRGFINWK